jgi:GNAT superfamily N-acetyltransferase
VNVTVQVVRLTELPEGGLADLAAEAERGGFAFVRRLLREWESGAVRFDGPGEALFAALAGGRVVGVCGLTADPYTDDARVGRVRHLYVAAAHRRRGVGRGLVGEVVRAARGRFDLLRLRTKDEAAARFYAALDFVPARGEPDCTHVMGLRPAAEE